MKDKKSNKRVKTIFKHQGYYPQLETKIVEEVRQARAEGQAIGTFLFLFSFLLFIFANFISGKTWLAERAQELNKELKHDYKFTSGWVSRMMDRNGIVLCAVQNTHKEGVIQAILKVYFI